ncbi:hypothetical protein FOZ63_021969 [Perkinsus olseni]|uniref:Uncharacterized protein n=1 Tax=Perkinsus olseni TaxID=32597 RepID=A0A7J6R101_PEROL|nr:hypothetical protein FOZ63_021969 [Perkinsus olseni]
MSSRPKAPSISAELPLHIDLVPAPDAVKAVQGFWDLGHKTVAKRVLVCRSSA